MCSIEDCEGSVEARGWCRKHYGRWYRHGDPLADDHRTSEHRPRLPGCSVVDCPFDHYAKGLCRNHYARAHRLRPEPFVCAQCGTTFEARRHSSDRRFCSRQCKGKARFADGSGQQSVRRWQFKTKYGITIDEYEILREGQGRACAICGRTDPIGRVSKFGPDYWLHVDHNHETGAVRGLLCSNCNQALGLLGEDPVNAARATDYLSS